MRISNSILVRCPAMRRPATLSNVKWMSRNIRLSNTEREEIIQAIRELRKKKDFKKHDTFNGY
jgi:hypothetical protein